VVLVRAEDLRRAVGRNGAMARWVSAVCVVVVVGLLVAKPVASDVEIRNAAAAPSLYGFGWRGSLELVRVDRETLRPLGGRRVPLAGLGGEPLAWSFAPDRSWLAFGSSAGEPRLRLISLPAMRARGAVKIARRGSLVATAWTGSRRVLAVVVVPGCCGAGNTIVVAVDRARRRVVWRKTLEGSLQAGERVGRRLLMVLGPRGRSIGPSRIVEIGARGRIRSAELPEIRSGNEPSAPVAGGHATRSWNPGLAVDGSGSRAFVVQAEAPVAELDLSTFQVRSHALPLRSRTADAVVGPTRRALWLGRGMLAVTGCDDRRDGQRPAGLTLIDTRDWRARTIDTRATDAALAAGTLLASSFRSGSGGNLSGSGLTGYTIDGKRKFHLYPREPIFGVQPLGRRALVGAEDRTVLIDARAGRQIHSYRRFLMTLLSRDQPIYY
jgi:hypothetical protein